MKDDMIQETSFEAWYAIQVRTRWERSAATLLSGKGYEMLLPTYASKRRWAGRLRDFQAPLFPGYVFCRFDASKRLPILITPGVIAVVGRGRIPVPIDPSEMLAIHSLVSSGVSAEPWPYLEVGQHVKIESEALQGVEGILVAFRGGHRVVISISLLCRSVAMEVDRARVIPISRPKETKGREVAPRAVLDPALV